MDSMDQLYDKFMGKVKHEAVKLKREAKRIAELETPLEKSLREATSNQNWGCPNSILYELALACQQYSDRQKILKKCWERLQSKEDKWRRVLKTLILIDYILKNGPEQATLELQGEQAAFRKLLGFKCVEEGQDRGAAIRDRARSILDLLTDRERLKEEREKAKEHQSKMRHDSHMPSSESGCSTRASGTGGSGSAGKTGGISRASFEERFNELKQKRDQERSERGHFECADSLAVADEAEGVSSGDRHSGRDEHRERARGRQSGGLERDRGAAMPKVAAPGTTGRASGRTARRPEDSDDSDGGERPAAAPPMEDLLDMCPGPASSTAAPAAPCPPRPAPAAPGGVMLPPPPGAQSAAPQGSEAGLSDLLGEAPAATPVPTPAPAPPEPSEDLFGDGGAFAFQGATQAVIPPGGAFGAAPAPAGTVEPDLFGGFQGSAGPGFAAAPGPPLPGAPGAPWAPSPVPTPAPVPATFRPAPPGGSAAGAASGGSGLDLEDAFELALGPR